MFWKFFASVDTLVIGRKTFEVVLAFPEWPYGSKQVIVLSNHSLDFSCIRGAVVEQMSGAPADIFNQLAARGFFEFAARSSQLAGESGHQLSLRAASS